VKNNVNNFLVIHSKKQKTIKIKLNEFYPHQKGEHV